MVKEKEKVVQKAKDVEMSEIGKPISEHAQKPKVFDKTKKVEKGRQNSTKRAGIQKQA